MLILLVINFWPYASIAITMLILKFEATHANVITPMHKYNGKTLLILISWEIIYLKSEKFFGLWFVWSRSCCHINTIIKAVIKTTSFLTTSAISGTAFVNLWEKGLNLCINLILKKKRLKVYLSSKMPCS